MSSLTIANKKYLENFVKQTITELMDPVENPELFGPREVLTSAYKQQASEHKAKYEDQIKNLSAAASWVLTTDPAITRRDDENPLVFDANAKMEQIFEILEDTEINANRQQSISNIQAALASFIDAVGDDTILRHSGAELGHERGSVEYSETFWNYLYEQKGTSLNTNMDKEIVKLLNFRPGSIPGGQNSGFRDFYYASINDVNKSAPKAAMHYIAWKVAADESIRETYTALFLPISIALGFWTAPLLAKYFTSKLAIFLVELVLWEFIIPMTLVPGEMQIPVVNVTYEEVVRPLDELLEDMQKSQDTKVSESELARFNAATKDIDKLMAKYISDWARASHPEVEPVQMKSIRVAAMASNQEAEKTDAASLNRKWMIRLISNRKEIYSRFFKGLDSADPKAIKVTWGKAMDLHMRQIGDSLKSAGKKYFDMQRAAGAGILAREGARVDTISGKFGIDKKIAEIIGIRNSNKVGPMSAGFRRIYNSWARGSKNPSALARTTKRNVGNTWRIAQRQFSSNVPKGNKSVPSHDLHKLMERGWCVYATMPLYALIGGTAGMGQSERSMLSLGIMKRGRAGAFLCSYFSERSSGAINDGFMKMIKYGAIGRTASGEIVPPEHNASGVGALSRVCTAKGNKMAEVAKQIELEFKSGKIEENFYNRRLQFAKTYSAFYLELGIILQRCSSSDELGGYCGGDLPGDIHNAFQAVTAWHNEVTS